MNSSAAIRFKVVLSSEFLVRVRGTPSPACRRRDYVVDADTPDIPGNEVANSVLASVPIPSELVPAGQANASRGPSILWELTEADAARIVALNNNTAMGALLSRVLELKRAARRIRQHDQAAGLEMSSSLLSPSVRAGIQADAVVDFGEEQDG